MLKRSGIGKMNPAALFLANFADLVPFATLSSKRRGRYGLSIRPPSRRLDRNGEDPTTKQPATALLFTRGWPSDPQAAYAAAPAAQARTSWQQPRPPGICRSRGGENTRCPVGIPSDAGSRPAEPFRGLLPPDLNSESVEISRFKARLSAGGVALHAGTEPWSRRSIGDVSGCRSSTRRAASTS